MLRTIAAGLLLVNVAVAADAPRGAGIIPYACVNGSVVFLLAYDPVPGRWGWGTFGGRPKADERTAETALREFIEETNCAFDATEVGRLDGPSRSGGFHSFVARVPFRTAATIAQARVCRNVERSDWVWVTHDALLHALAETGAEPSIGTASGDRSIHLWSKAARSLRQARLDRLLPPPTACQD